MSKKISFNVLNVIYLMLGWFSPKNCFSFFIFLFVEKKLIKEILFANTESQHFYSVRLPPIELELLTRPRSFSFFQLIFSS